MVLTNAAERLKEARLRAGLSLEAVVERVGISKSEYWDMEGYDNELSSNTSLARLSIVCHAVGISPADLVLGPHGPRAGSSTSFTTISEALNERMRTQGLSVPAFGEQVGWELKDVLIDPDELWNFTIDGIQDVCRAAGLAWEGVLMSIEAPNQSEEESAG